MMNASEMARKRWRDVPAAERRAAMSAAGKKGGRPLKLVKCGKCGVSGGTMAMRKHRCA